MSLLFSPLEIRNVRLRNRIAVSPMCQYSARGGYATDWHLVHLATRAVGGAGLVIAEATAVSPEGRISPYDLGIWEDGHTAMLGKIAENIHANGAVAGIQLAHAGRKASCAAPWEGGRQIAPGETGWQTIAPSAIPFTEGEVPPVALTITEIRRIINAFASAARRALDAGFKIIEIHSAHGYLLHEFLSPISNHRMDEYGGSFENRTRLLREVAESVRKVWPSGLPLFVRISSTDWVEGGWSLDESIMLAGILSKMDVDLIDCSSAGNVVTKIPVGPGYQVPFAEAIRKTGIMTGAVGMITAAQQAESILREEKADLILMGRELLRNPYFPILSAKELGDDIAWPVQYLRAR